MPPHFFEGLKITAEVHIHVLEVVVRLLMDEITAERDYMFQKISTHSQGKSPKRGFTSMRLTTGNQMYDHIVAQTAIL